MGPLASASQAVQASRYSWVCPYSVQMACSTASALFRLQLADFILQLPGLGRSVGSHRVQWIGSVVDTMDQRSSSRSHKLLSEGASDRMTLTR
ncbi:hypothetical protein NPIL_133431 [Nephila pilipes]|uniref:Uncharacterized protein n=1 Tax=Nephila pilipes TaxID=299642 RepID=A0A8X6MX65_NEPPI|nr:hypothetical protein NPIL_133431 [Nephila pilipes]